MEPRPGQMYLDTRSNGNRIAVVKHLDEDLVHAYSYNLAASTRRGFRLRLSTLTRHYRKMSN